MAEGKYIMIDEIHPVVFPSVMEHKQFKDIPNITSAGFYRTYIEDGKFGVDVYGESLHYAEVAKRMITLDWNVF